MKILLVGDLSIQALSNSFIRAFHEKGFEVKAYDISQVIAKHVKLGKIGSTIHTFFPVETWLRKGNKELAVFFKEYGPDKVIVIGNAPVLFSTLAFCKSISNAQWMLYWPDTLTNLEQIQLNAVALYDLVATYSSATVPVFKELGFKDVIWSPFAGDIDFLGKPDKFDGPFDYDVAFAGGWRPERERVLTAVINNFPGLRVHARGFNWKENCKDKNILKNLVPSALFGREFGDLFRKSRINLNVIDDTNYPAANMRYFEIPASGGLQLCSPCPEMENSFLDNQHILYFKNESDILNKIDWVVNHPENAQALRKKGFELVNTHHTYDNRIREILHDLKSNNS